MPFSIERNDLATVEADAIVVAANERLRITGGVGMTVARAAGLEELQAACDEIGFCPCGSAVATPAFRLKAKTVIHAVGPMWRGGGCGEADFLRSAYDAALECAVDEGSRSIALPLISAGTYGFPADVSLAVARESIRAFLNRRDNVDVRLVLYSKEAVTAGMAAYLDIVEYIGDNYFDGNYPGDNYFDDNHPGDNYFDDNHPDNYPGGNYLGDRPDRFSVMFGASAAPAGRIEAAEKEPGAFAPALEEAAVPSQSLEDLLDSIDAPFSTTVLALIDDRGMTDAQVYKRANMSRQLFSKIRSDAGYHPTKKTVLALSVALGLSLTETNDLLGRAGFALSKSSKADVIVEYFISRGNYDIFEINEALYAFDQPLL